MQRHQDQNRVVRGSRASYVRERAEGPQGMAYVATSGPKRALDVRFSPDGDALYVVDTGAFTVVQAAAPKPISFSGTGVVWQITREGAGVDVSPRPLTSRRRRAPAELISRAELASWGANRMPRIIVFDVNETLLDLQALDPQFERVFGTAGVRRDWFKQVLQSALLTTVLDAYSDFGAVGAAALEMMAAVHDVRLTDDDRKAILGTMRELPPHPEVAESLGRLREAGLRIAALTNSTEAVAEAQLEHAGLSSHFERILSADAVRRLKPHAEVYRMAARELGVEPGAIRLVAAHSWDVAGALRAGCAAAFVARPGMTLDPLFEPPDIAGEDLVAVAEQILDTDRPPSIQ